MNEFTQNCKVHKLLDFPLVKEFTQNCKVHKLLDFPLVKEFVCLFCFLVTPINQFLIILGRCTLYTPVCLQDEPTYMRIEPV